MSGGLDLRRFGDWVLEERAGFAVLRELAWSGSSVSGIHRPEEVDPTSGGRKVDFVFELDGTTTALEIVRLTDDADAMNATHRFRALLAKAKRRALDRFDEHSSGQTLVLDIDYKADAMLDLRGRTLDDTATAIADAAFDATTGRPLGEMVDVDFAAPWLASIRATRLAGRAGITTMSASDAGLPDVDDWLKAVIDRKGAQHVGFAERGILGIVVPGYVEHEDVADAIHRLGADTPWWRIYTMDLEVDRGALVEPSTDGMAASPSTSASGVTPSSSLQ